MRLRRKGRERDLLVRVAARTADDGGIEGYVVSFDDVTDLVVAQRMAAWGDVARRIAHEVKNPLTPIQLSAERLRRKFGPMVGEERAALEQYADVIVRQTNDLRRIVDEFSKFARMPAPERRPLDLGRLVADAVVLQETGAARHPLRVDAARARGPGASRRHDDQPGLHQPPEERRRGHRRAAGEGPAGRPARSAWRWRRSPSQLVIDIQDNGTGLPDQPARLFEPYVTHRAKGTGLGLPIVKKIVEEHDGTLELMPAPLFEGATGPAPGRGSCCRRRCRSRAGKATRKARSPKS